MSDYEEFSPRRLYRDTEKGMIAGVVAGLAQYFGFAVGASRLFVVISAFFFFPFVVLAYICAAMMLRPMPKELKKKNQKDEEFMQELRRSPKATFSAVRYRLRQLDRSVQRMERYVTSSRFKLDRDFRNLEREDGRQ